MCNNHGVIASSTTKLLSMRKHLEKVKIICCKMLCMLQCFLFEADYSITNSIGRKVIYANLMIRSPDLRGCYKAGAYTLKKPMFARSVILYNQTFGSKLQW